MIHVCAFLLTSFEPTDRLSLVTSEHRGESSRCPGRVQCSVSEVKRADTQRGTGRRMDTLQFACGLGHQVFLVEDSCTTRRASGQVLCRQEGKKTKEGDRERNGNKAQARERGKRHEKQES